MKSIASRLVRVVASVAILAGASSALAAQDLPKKGTCGFLASMHYPFAYQYRGNAGPGWGLNILATLDFETRQFAGNIVMINPGGFEDPNGTTTQEQQTVAGPFTISNGPFAGSYAIKATISLGSESHTFTWNVVPVNNGRTLLMQEGPGQLHSADGGVAGVCQF
jgi:hypothetical protein